MAVDLAAGLTTHSTCPYVRWQAHATVAGFLRQPRVILGRRPDQDVLRHPAGFAAATGSHAGLSKIRIPRF